MQKAALPPQKQKNFFLPFMYFYLLSLRVFCSHPKQACACGFLQSPRRRKHIGRSSATFQYGSTGCDHSQVPAMRRSFLHKYGWEGWRKSSRELVKTCHKKEGSGELFCRVPSSFPYTKNRCRGEQTSFFLQYNDVGTSAVIAGCSAAVAKAIKTPATS